MTVLILGDALTTQNNILERKNYSLLSSRQQKVSLYLIKHVLSLLDANSFRDAFEAARLFNHNVKEENQELLVFAPLFEEAPIAPEVTESIIDNPDINKEPEEADHVDAFGAEL